MESIEVHLSTVAHSDVLFLSHILFLERSTKQITLIFTEIFPEVDPNDNVLAESVHKSCPF